jgi:hypothetical protein
MDGLVIVEKEEELTAYVTIDGVVHGVRWLHYGHDWADFVLVCGPSAPVSTRTSKDNVEVITCVECLARGAEDGGG